MKIKVVKVGLFCLLLLIINIVILSCEVERKFDVEVLEEFSEQITSNYTFIQRIEIKRSQGHVVIKMNFDSNDDFDTQIYEDIRTYFLDVEIQNQMIEAYDSEDLEGKDYPTIRVEFIDQEGIDTHYIKSPLEKINYGQSWVTGNRYEAWSYPAYDDHREFFYIETADEETLVERALLFDEIKDMLLASEQALMVDLYYNFLQVEPEYNSLKLYINSNNEAFDTLKHEWMTRFENHISIHVERDDNFRWSTSHDITYLGLSSTNQNIFYNEKVSGGYIAATVFFLNPDKLLTDLSLQIKQDYTLNLVLDSAWKVTGYKVKVIE